MTYFPIKPLSATPTASALADANTFQVIQGGITKTATMAMLDAYVLGGSGATGATGGGSTGSTGAAPGASLAGTLVTTVGPTISDGAGNTYAFNASGYVVTNGTLEDGLNGHATTANVNAIYWDGTHFWQRNTAGGWYTRTNPSAIYTGPTQLPESPEAFDVATIGPVIVDAAGNTYGLNAGGYVVANGVQEDGTNGTRTSGGVNELYYHAPQVGGPRQLYQRAGTDWYTSPNLTTAYAGPVSSPKTTAQTSAPTLGAMTATPATVPGDWAIDLRSATGQTVYGDLYGFGTGALADNKFAFTGDANVQPAIKKLQPRVFRININANVGGAYWQDYIFRNGIGSPDWSALDPLFDNAPSWFAPNTQIVMGVGGSDNNMSAADMGNRAKAIAQRAITKGHPIRLWEVGNEANGKTSQSLYNAWLIAVADALHSVDASYLVMGPVNSYASSTVPDSGILSLANAAGSKLGGVCAHTYAFGHWTDRPSLYTTTDMLTQANVMRQTVDQSSVPGLPLFLGEWNIVSDVSNLPEQQNIAGAIYNAMALFSVMDANINARWGAVWEMLGDGTYGAVNDPAAGYNSDYRVYPGGQFLASAGQLMDGARVTASWGKGGNIKHYACKSGSNWAAQIINYDTGVNQSGVKVGITGPASVSSSVTMWQISAANPNGVITTPALASLTSAGLTWPSESITHLSGTFA